MRGITTGFVPEIRFRQQDQNSSLTPVPCFYLYCADPGFLQMKSFELKESTVRVRLVRILLCVAIGLGLLAGGIWVLTQTLGEREVLYQRKSLYEWSKQIKSQNLAASNQASLVLNQEIIPGLTKTMFEDTNDSSLRIALVENLNGLPGVNIFFRVADSRRASAAAGFGEFG